MGEAKLEANAHPPKANRSAATPPWGRHHRKHKNRAQRQAPSAHSSRKKQWQSRQESESAGMRCCCAHAVMILSLAYGSAELQTTQACKECEMGERTARVFVGTKEHGASGADSRACQGRKNASNRTTSGRLVYQCSISQASRVGAHPHRPCKGLRAAGR